MTIRLTDDLILQPTDKRRRLFDKACRDFQADISPTGNVTFRLKIWSITKGKQDTITLGSYNPETFTTEIARREAFKLKGQGGDIAAKVKNTRAAIAVQGVTFNQVCDEYIAYYSVEVSKFGTKLPRKESIDQCAYFLRAPRAAFGDTAIREVTAREILSLLIATANRGKLSLAIKLRATISSVFTFAAQAGREYVTANPCSILPSQDKPEKKERNLDDDEIRVLWWGLDRPDCPIDRRTALAFKLILCTGLRPGNVLETTRGAIGNIPKLRGGDGHIGYRVPAARDKKRRVNAPSGFVQPLNTLAQEIVAELLQGEDDLLFRSITTSKLSQALQGKIEVYGGKKVRKLGLLKFLGFTAAKGEPFAPFTSHDLRRTATTHLGINDVGAEDKARVLGHTIKSSFDTLPVYDVSEEIKQTARRRVTLAKLDNILREIIGEPPKVVRLRVA